MKALRLALLSSAAIVLFSCEATPTQPVTAPKIDTGASIGTPDNFQTKGTYGINGYTDQEVVPGVRLYEANSIKTGIKVAKVYLPSAKIGPIVKSVVQKYDPGQKRTRNAFQRFPIKDFYDYAVAQYKITPVITVNAPFFGFENPTYLSAYFATQGTELESGGKGGCAFIVNNLSSQAVIDRIDQPMYAKAHLNYQHVITGGQCLLKNGAAVNGDTKYSARPTSAEGRTAYGVKGNSEVFLMVAVSATTQQMIDELKKFGVENAMMFDGSGSSQMMKFDKKMISGDGRPLPIAYGVYRK